MPKVPLITGAYTARSVIAEAQRCINLYIEKNPDEDAVFPFTHYPTPGLEFLASGGGAPPSPPAPPPGVVTWNPLDMTVNGVLDVTRLMYSQATDELGAVRAQYPRNVGKWYWEVNQNGPANGTRAWVGVSDIADSISAVATRGGPFSLYYETNVESGEFSIAGTIYENFNLSIATGGRVAFALDIPNLLLWISLTGGSPFGWNTAPQWNGELGFGDPGTNVNGVGTANRWVTVAPGTAPGASAPVLWFTTKPTGDVRATLYPEAADFEGPIPTGFSAPGPMVWNSVAPTVLSNADRTITLPAGTAVTAISGSLLKVLATGSHSSGKWYYEIGVEENGSTALLGLGFLGVGTSSIFDGGAYVPNASDLVSGAGVGAGWAGGDFVSTNNPVVLPGHRWGIADDRDNNRWWIRDLGARPDLGRGGIDISLIKSSGLLTPSSGNEFTGFLGTADFGAQTFAGTLPSGFTNGWGFAGGVVP